MKRNDLVSPNPTQRTFVFLSLIKRVGRPNLNSSRLFALRRFCCYSGQASRKLFSRRASATAEYTEGLQQRALAQLSLEESDAQESASVSSRGRDLMNAEDEVLRKYLNNKNRRGSVSTTGGDKNETLVKAGVLKDLRGKLATTEQKLRVVQSDLVTKCDEVRKLLAKVSRLEREKSRALQSQIEALPKSDRKKAKASIWSKLEKDTKKRDAR